MSRRAQIDAALVELVRVLGEQLAGSGWSRRPLGAAATGTFTRPTRAGLLATAELRRAGFRFPDGWPVAVRLVLGVGYEPALGLAPLLTVPTFACELADPAAGWLNGAAFELTGTDDIPSVARTLAARADQSADTFADTVDGVDALIAAQAAERDQGVPETGGPDATPPSGAGGSDATPRSRAGGSDAGPSSAAGSPPVTEAVPSLAQLVLLAAAGRLAVDDTPLRRFEADPISDFGSARRFVRQLRRWLDAGSPAPPPVEQTLQRLPETARGSGPVADPGPARAADVRAARESVRRSSRGASRDAVRTALVAEYTRRGLPVSEWDADTTSELLHLRTLPFGRLRAGLRAGVLLGRVAAQVVHRLRHLDERQPAWLRPPARAAYPLPGGAGEIRVRLDPGTEALLARAAEDTVTRLAHAATVPVWLVATGADSDRPGEITAHLGGERVGVVPDGDAFAEALRAAAVFDEDLLTTGVLTRAGRNGWHLDVTSPGGRVADAPVQRARP